MRRLHKNLIFAYGVASATVVIVLILTVFSLASPSSRQDTALYGFPIVTCYGLGYSVIVCVLLTPLILLLSRVVLKVNRFRWLLVLVVGPILGLLAAFPWYYFQKAGELFHMEDDRFSAEQISIWFLVLGAMAGFAGSITFALTDSRSGKHEISPE